MRVGSGLLRVTRTTFSKKAPNAGRAFRFRRTREFGREGIIMAPIERFFIAMAVSGFIGLIATLAWMMVS
jgi:hypothetical protein